MSTEKENRHFIYGLLCGVGIAMAAMGGSIGICKIQDPLYGVHPNTILNDPEYTIDTIVTTSHHNTIVEYKFIKVEEEE